MKTAEYGRIGPAKLLLGAGADVDMKNNEGDTAHNIATHFEQTDIVELLNLHASASVPDHLWKASELGDTGRVHALLSAGADVNSVDADGWGALMWAADGGCCSVMELLIGAGAEVDACDRWGLVSARMLGMFVNA